ncbi:MAG TPA: glycoside hydrolase family 5 candidate endoglucanase [Eubacterium sp.]|nr:glycoside hydrolase family 5 candidate endoglucanase [Eubacterium sp.]
MNKKQKIAISAVALIVVFFVIGFAIGKVMKKSDNKKGGDTKIETKFANNDKKSENSKSDDNSKKDDNSVKNNDSDNKNPTNDNGGSTTTDNNGSTTADNNGSTTADNNGNSNNGNGNSNGNGNNTTTNNNNSSNNNSGSNNSGSNNSNTQTSSLSAKANASNSWNTGSGYGIQYDFTVTNTGSSTISGWMISYDVPAGTSVQSFWNCNAKIENNKLIIDAAGSYAESIAAGETKKDMGIILMSSSNNPITGAATASSQNKSSGNSSTSGNSSSSSTSSGSVNVVTNKAVSNHGKLKVSGRNLVDASGNPYRLCGVSTHGIQWFGQYVNQDTFAYFATDFNANVIRLACYVEEGGYLQGNRDNMRKLIFDGVEYAKNLDMYVIIDWHILNFDPMKHKSEAIEFFDEMSKKYANYDNVIFEICNEPVGATWSGSIKPYAKEVVATIRKNCDNLILVGTNNWSQDVDDVIGNELDASNVMYVLHFYASSSYHQDNLKDKFKKAVNAGLPIFVSECSICDETGNGYIDHNLADAWFDLLDDYNTSFVTWNISNKAESSSLIASWVTKLSGFSDSDLSEAGLYFKNRIRNSIK